MNDSTYETVDLSRYDDYYQKAKQGDVPPPFRPVPDGRYQVIVETVELTKTRTTGNPMLKWRLRISGPQMADRILWKNAVITERTIPFITKELTLCGLTMQSLSELPTRLPDLLNLRLEVNKRGRTEGPDDVFFEKNLTAIPVHANAAAAASVGGPSAAYDLADREVHYGNEDVNDDLPF